MNENKKILIKNILDNNYQGKDFEKFNSFSTYSVMKNHGIILENEQVDTFITEGNSDCGVDSFIILINDKIVFSLEDLDNYQESKTDINIIWIQSKYTEKFELKALEKINANIKQLLGLNELNKMKNFLLKDKIILFKKIIEKVLGTTNNFSINFEIYYCTVGDYKNLTDKHEWISVEDSIREQIQKEYEFINPKITFNYFGFLELYSNFHSNKNKIKIIKVDDSFTQTFKGSNAVVAVVKLKDYINFLETKNGGLDSDLFSNNIRDYQNNTNVNKSIKVTLSKETENDFWWLNNGVTVLVDSIKKANHDFSLENPQIVNGLQTSYTIHESYSKKELSDMERKILIKLIEIKNDEQAMEIIAATNNQNAINDSNLKAADQIQKIIEDYLRIYGYYYERRKKEYSNKNKDKNKIISIQSLAQSFSSIINKTPSKARRSSASYFKNEKEYKLIFNYNIPLSNYLIVTKISKFIMNNINSISLEEIINEDEKTIKNIIKKIMKYHCMYIFNKTFNLNNDFEKLEESFTEKNLEFSFDNLYKKIIEYMNINNLKSSDIIDISKSSDFDNFLLTEFKYNQNSNSSLIEIN